MNQIEKQFPKTYKLIEEMCQKESKEKRQKHKYLFWKDVIVKTKEQVFQDNMMEYLDNVKEPIYSVCEDLLNHWYEAEFETRDKGVVQVGEVEFKIEVYYHFHKDLSITPSISENTHEAWLLKECFWKVRNYETNGIYREKLLDYYKG